MLTGRGVYTCTATLFTCKGKCALGREQHYYLLLSSYTLSFFSKAFPGVLQQCVDLVALYLVHTIQQCAGWTETVHMVHALHSIVVLQSMCFIQHWYNIVNIALL